MSPSSLPPQASIWDQQPPHGPTNHGATLVARASFGTVLGVGAVLVGVAALLGAPPVVYGVLSIGGVGAAIGYRLWRRGHHALATALHTASLIGAGLASIVVTGSTGGATGILLLASVITAGGLRGLRAAAAAITASIAAVGVGLLLGPGVRAVVGLPAAGWHLPEPILVAMVVASLPAWGVYVLALAASSRRAWLQSERDRTRAEEALQGERSARRALAETHSVEQAVAQVACAATAATEETDLLALIRRLEMVHRWAPPARAAFLERSRQTLTAWRERRDLLEVRARLARDVQLRERHAAIERLCAGTAHDLNNALTSVIGIAETVRDAADAPPPVVAATDRLIQSALHGARVVGTLARYGRGLHGDTCATDVHAVLEETRCLLTACGGDRTPVELEITGPPCSVRIDREPLERALLNLVQNAVQAIPDDRKGRVRVCASTELDAAPPHLRITVEDDGVGMDEATRTHAAEPYFSRWGRTGLGLTLVQGLAHQSAGELRIHSAPDSGTRIALTLPIDPERDEPVAAHAPAPHRLLLIDDDAQVRRAIARMCRSLGYTVIEAEDRAEAVEALEHAPSLVVSDIRLADDDGVDVVAHLRAVGLSAPVLFITGYAGPRAHRASRDPVLLKPFRREALAQALAALQPPPARTGSGR
jgi:signal transduction histidine kinase